MYSTIHYSNYSERQNREEGCHELVRVGRTRDTIGVEEREEVEHNEFDDVDEEVKRIRIFAPASERVGLAQARHDLPCDDLFEGRRK